jgi:hypothetical protein
VAFARLAWLAGDLDTYEYACGVVARELVHHYVKQRGADWFREQQPWHTDEPMDGEVYLTNLWGDLAGWQIDGPFYPERTGERQYGNRWVRFQDLDVARFYREHLAGEVRREMEGLRARWAPKRWYTTTATSCRRWSGAVIPPELEPGGARRDRQPDQFQVRLRA